MMKAFVLSLSLAGPAWSLNLDSFDYKDASDLQKAWMPQEESRPGAMTMDGNMVKAGRLPLSFSTLKGWRVFWDRDIKANLKEEEQILVTLRAADPTAVAQAILYMRSGEGWYVFPPFSVGGQYEVKSLVKAQAAVEGKPTGWHAIDRVRIAFLPGKKTDTHVDFAGLATRAGWPLSHAGAMGGYKDFPSAKAGLWALAKGRACAKDVAQWLAAAEKTLAEAARETDKDLRQELILKAREHASKAYALVQDPPKGPEERIFWVHHGDGVRAIGGEKVASWKEVLPQIRALGFNAIAPNVLWSGVAYYPSKVVNSKIKGGGEADYLREVLDAAKPLGMKVHAWKVMWQFPDDWLSPLGTVDPFKKAGRLQKNLKGEDQPWLCPSLRQNRDFEIAAITELLRNYEVDGFHLDYIRYGGAEVCFCRHCKAAFESWSKKKVGNWPADAAPGGIRDAEYGDFKRDNITSMVREIRAAAKKARPGVELSAAVFPSPSIARTAVFQDWPRWVEEGLLDMVSTMTYTEDAGSFKAQVRQQMEITKGKVKLIPGIGFTFDAGRVLDLQNAVDQIKAVRELGLPGFNIFEYRDHLQDTLLPWLSAGLLREGEYRLKFRETPAYAKKAQGEKGRAVEGAGKTVWVDDFEDSDTVNRLKGAWSADMDMNGLGTRIAPRPFSTVKGGPGKSKFAAGVTGQLGLMKNNLWPYATLSTGLAPGNQAADLSPFRSIRFKARGDGKGWLLALRQNVVKDYGFYRAAFTAPKDWTEVVLPLSKFAQPGFAKAVEKAFVDVTLLQFQLDGREGEAFELQIDDLRLER